MRTFTIKEVINFISSFALMLSSLVILIILSSMVQIVMGDEPALTFVIFALIFAVAREVKKWTKIP